MPIFWVMTPVRTLRSLLDFDGHAGGQVELHQSVDGLRRGVDDVEQFHIPNGGEIFPVGSIPVGSILLDLHATGMMFRMKP